MTNNKESAWDQIPSLNLTMDDDYGERVKSKEGRRHSRSDLSDLQTTLHSGISSLPIRVATAAYGIFDGLILDISESGCRIALPNKLKKGELTKVRFIVEQRTVITKGIVKWSSLKNDGCTVGLEFKELPGDIKDFLCAICSASKFNKVGKVK